jgi:DNA primase
MKKLLIILFTFQSLLSSGQSKKEQIQVLNFKVDSLNSELNKERKKFESKLDALNSSLDSRNIEISNKNTELQNLRKKLEINISKVEELKVVNKQNSDSIKSLNKAVLLSNNKVDSLTKKIDLIISMNPVNTLLFNTSTGDMIYGNSLDTKNAEFEDYSEKYCGCMSAVIKLMNQNKDYDEAMGGYGIDGYNQMSKAEKKITRAKQILLYNLSPPECASFGDPDYFSLLFDKEVLNLCDNW